jgi:hypothetical protein
MFLFISSHSNLMLICSEPVTFMAHWHYISFFTILKNYFVIKMVQHNFNFHNIIVISKIMGEVISTVTTFIVIINEHSMHRASN